MTHDLRETFSARLREAQSANGLNTTELANETGINLRLVQKHRAGLIPGHANLLKYARVLKRPVSYFFEEAA